MKRILVTGATGNIGAPLVSYLANKSEHLVLGGRDQGKLQILANSLEGQQAKVYPICFDYENATSYSSVQETCQSGLDGLVLMTPRIPASTDCFPREEEWEQLFRQTFIKPLSFLKSLIGNLELSPRSKVVIVSGLTSIQLLNNYAMNGAIRSAWLAQTKALAFEYGPKNIHFNTLSLGGIMTDTFVEKLKEEAQARHISFEEIVSERTANVPLQKYASPLEIAQVIEGLLSPMTDHMTGMNFICDGGFVKAY